MRWWFEDFEGSGCLNAFHCPNSTLSCSHLAQPSRPLSLQLRAIQFLRFFRKFAPLNSSAFLRVYRISVKTSWALDTEPQRWLGSLITNMELKLIWLACYVLAHSVGVFAGAHKSYLI